MIYLFDNCVVPFIVVCPAICTFADVLANRRIREHGALRSTLHVTHVIINCWWNARVATVQSAVQATPVCWLPSFKAMYPKQF